MKAVEIWIAMDTDGDFAVSINDEHEAIELHQSDYGSTLALRVVKITVNMAPPEIIEAGEVTVPDEAGQVVTATAAE